MAFVHPMAESWTMSRRVFNKLSIKLSFHKGNEGWIKQRVEVIVGSSACLNDEVYEINLYGKVSAML